MHSLMDWSGWGTLFFLGGKWSWEADNKSLKLEVTSPNSVFIHTSRSHLRLLHYTLTLALLESTQIVKNRSTERSLDFLEPGLLKKPNQRKHLALFHFYINIQYIYIYYKLYTAKTYWFILLKGPCLLPLLRRFARLPSASLGFARLRWACSPVRSTDHILTQSTTTDLGELTLDQQAGPGGASKKGWVPKRGGRSSEKKWVCFVLFYLKDIFLWFVFFFLPFVVLCLVGVFFFLGGCFHLLWLWLTLLRVFLVMCMTLCHVCIYNPTVQLLFWEWKVERTGYSSDAR